tara:strand:+ start:6618 stop:8189 length:1572 start_codon:yes stop_codon:yes gene_type:complete
MKRFEGLKRIESEETPWDILIIGGGSTGLGSALDAVSRGFRTLLIEQDDFGKGTSSRSTKLIHGGVRYLRQGNVSLVSESLAERGWLVNSLPNLVQPQLFLIPTFSFWETWYYRIGLWMYDRLAGALGLNSSKRCNRDQALELIPTLKPDRLSGGVVYWDGLFDDARLCIEIADTVWKNGGLALNYVRAESLLKEDGKVFGVSAVDSLSGSRFDLEAKVVIQATGIFSDKIRIKDSNKSTSIIQASRGSHIVMDGSFLPNGNAIMVPKTSDGRLLFLVPWHGKVIAGTTDIPDENICLEPKATDEEIDFIIENAAPYLAKTLTREDVSSAFSGLRPLVTPPKSEGNTASISRDHYIEVSESGLITIAGGKWTTFRKMGEDAIDTAIQSGGLEDRPSRSQSMKFSGDLSAEDSSHRFARKVSNADTLQSWIEEDPKLGERIHERLDYSWAEVLWAIREELSESVEDVLARRTRSLFLDASASLDIAPSIAQFMAEELGRDSDWEEQSIAAFNEIADAFRVNASD